MTTARHQPHLDPTAQALREAIERAGLTSGAVAKAIGRGPNTVWLWTRARASVDPNIARALGKLLKVDPDTIASARLQRSSKKGKAREPGKLGRPLGSLNRTTNGPAARAVALLEARTPVLAGGAAAYAVNGAQGAAKAPREGGAAQGVFRMEARADGTVAIWVQTVYPMEQGAQFVRWLLDFGVLPAPPDPPPTG